MDSLRIERFRSRYRLPSGLRDERRRLDRLFTDSVEPLLALELEREGIGVHEEICLREVHGFARLRLSQADTQVAVTWSKTLAAAIGTAVRAGSDLVRYGSRHQALVDLLTSVARGDLSRAWAWRQLGLWSEIDLPDTTPVAEALHALMLEAAAAPAVLREAAVRGAFGRLLSTAPEAVWSAVARAALSAAGAKGELAIGSTGVRVRAAGGLAADIAGHVERIERKSAILRAARAHTGTLPLGSVRSLAILAVLEVEPALLRDPTRGRRVLETVDEKLRGPTRTDAPATPCESVDVEAVSVEPTERPRGDGRAGTESPLSDVRCRATTRAGGLLLLVHLIDALDLPAEIACDAILGSRSLRWVLHRLATRVALVDGRDPAALAFAGLRPSDEPPEEDLEMLETEPERAAILGLRARVLAALREYLPRERDSDERLLAFVCERDAEVVADPGWIEVRYALDDVSTEIRRAGLDLDPGWLPWLGVVMRFVYV